MKKIISAVLLITMLAALFVNVTIVQAASTLTTHLDMNMDGNYTTQADVAALKKTGTLDATVDTDDTTYGIGNYLHRQTISGVELNIPGDGISTKQNNLVVEYEFDYKYSAGSTATAGKGYYNGVQFFTDAEKDTDVNSTIGRVYFSNVKGNENVHIAKQNLSAVANGDIDTSNSYYFGKFGKVDEWHRVKVVAKVTDGSGAAYTSSDGVQIYLDGVKVANYAHGNNAKTDLATATKIDRIRLHMAYSYMSLDNFTIKSYTNPADAPVEKGALVKAIRDYEAAYPNHTSEADAVTCLNAAKQLEASATTKVQVDEAMGKVDEARKALFPRKTIISIDTGAYATVDALKKADIYAPYGSERPWSSSTIDTETEVYGIDKYNSNNKWGYNLKLGNNGIPITGKKNLYVEVEYDFKYQANIRTSAGEAYAGFQLYGDSRTISSTYDNTINYAYATSTFNHTYDTDTTSLSLKKGGSGSDVIKEGLSVDKWYRVRMVSHITDADGAIYTGTDALKIYLDGEPVKQYQYATALRTNNTDTKLERLRLWISNSQAAYDNLTVVSYTDTQYAVDKSALIVKMREFVKNYPGYTRNAEAKALFDEAEALYNSEGITPADAETATAKITAAETLMNTGNALIEEDFEDSPADFFGDPAVVIENDTAYSIGKYAVVPTGTATKAFDPVALDGDATFEYITAECDVKSSGPVTIGLTDSISHTLTGESGWKRVRFDVDTVKKTYDVYVDGIEVDTARPITEASVSAMTFTSTSSFNLDNVNAYSYNDVENVVADKGKLVKNLRDLKALIDEGTLSTVEREVADKAFANYSKVEQQTAPDDTTIKRAADNTEFYVYNLSENIAGSQSIIIPGTGTDLKNVVVRFALHYGGQLGDESYDHIFFDRTAEKDFSDVGFMNPLGTPLPSVIESSGNYEYIYDSDLPKTKMYYDPLIKRLWARHSGLVKYSDDNGATWISTGHSCKVDIEFVDRDSNVYYSTNDATYGPAAVYKLSAEDNWQTSELVIDCSDLTREGVKEASWANTFVQDDDGYIYAGRYQTEWTGAAVFVSDETGENFVVADFRPEKQHVHALAVNRHVYPNEVYIGFDDSLTQPLCYKTTDHLGYKKIKDSPDHQLPIKAVSTGGREDYKEKNKPGEGGLLPENEEAERIIEEAAKHITQVPIPYGNSDYVTYFGVIDDSEEKFSIAENGNEYTTTNNVFLIGVGEANILGGPGAYKSTDPMNPDKYYPVIENAQGARTVMSPAPGVLIWGGLSGGYAQTPQVAISYDDGETWTTAFSDGFTYAPSAAGNGSSRSITAPISHGGGVTEVLMHGYNAKSARMLFGGDHYMAMASVTIPTLPAEGMKICVKADGSADEGTTYYYGTIGSDTPAVKAETKAYDDSEVLTFPLMGSSKNNVYTFDIDTEAKTGVKARIMGATTHGIKPVVDVLIDTGNKTASLNDATGSFEGDGRISVKLVTSETECEMYINETLIQSQNIPGDYSSLSALTLMPVSVPGGNVPNNSVPVITYFSNVKYAAYSPNQFILDCVTMTKNGEPTNKITEGTIIESVKIRNLSDDIAGGVLLAGLYGEGNILKQVVPINVAESGTYPVKLTADEDGLDLRFFIFKNLETIMPLKLESLLEIN